MIDINSIGIMVHERHLRLLGFVAVFILMALWEFLAARRKEKIPRMERWPHNLALTLLNTFVIRVLFPSTAIGAAYWASSLRFGLFHWVEVPPLFASIFTVVAMDWVVYYQHRVFHAYPLFWKFHRMHHTDLEVDVTTGVRFHTGEMLLSMLIKSFFILLLGAPPAGAFLFEVILNASSLFTHSNIRMPAWLDKILRLVIVTPDMHRVHHSVIPAETNSNFGFNLSVWDRLLGTYQAQPKEGHEKMKIGLDVFHDEKYLPVNMLLEQPFLDKSGKFAWDNLMREK
jgi:sterol desaturase/sphingolipid hydroxylase (fatty acid hydroxylase superfamily)